MVFQFTIATVHHRGCYKQALGFGIDTMREVLVTYERDGYLIYERMRDKQSLEALYGAPPELRNLVRNGNCNAL
jgi:hypothetical protein